jgi:hypothetical protein
MSGSSQPCSSSFGRLWQHRLCNRRLRHPRPFADRRYQLRPIIGVDRNRRLGARYADIERLLIDKVSRAAVGVNDDVIGGAALGGKGGFDIGVADMLVAGIVEIQRLGLAAQAADGGGAGLFVDRGYFCAPAVDASRFAVVAGELDAVAGFQFERLRRKPLHFACGDCQ